MREEKINVERVKAWECSCFRCGHVWVGRSGDQFPKQCPHCKSPRWNIPRRGHTGRQEKEGNPTNKGKKGGRRAGQNSRGKEADFGGVTVVDVPWEKFLAEQEARLSLLRSLASLRRRSASEAKAEAARTGRGALEK